MNVLSLFDGMSCGQLALQKSGFPVDIYMASEIDKYGMQVTRKNFPNTIQMGDVCALKGENLPPIDLLMGGSPCQGFSFAGKQLNFDHPQSKLFFEFARLLKEVKPKYFLLENVRMKQEYQDVISEHLGVKPVMINSALLSAQNRVRLYWTNIPGLIQPEDKGIRLKDILEDEVDDSISDKRQKIVDKNLGDKLNQDHLVIGSSQKNAYIGKDKCSTLTQAMASGGGQIPMIKISQPKDKGILLKDILENDVDKEHYLTEVQKSKLDLDKPWASKDGTIIAKQAGKHQQDRIHHTDGKMGTLCGGTHGSSKHLTKIQVPITQPEDKGILLKDILETEPSNKYDLSDAHVDRVLNAPRGKGYFYDKESEKIGTLMAGYHKNPTDGSYIKQEPKVLIKDDYNPDLKTEQRLEPRLDEKSGTLTTVQKDNVLIVKEATKKGYTEIQDGDCFDMTFPTSKTRRGRNMKDKSNCLTAANYDYMRYEHPTYRKLTPTECERLQTIPDGYTEGVSNTQRYKMLGNGWTVDIICHLFEGIKAEFIRQQQEDAA